MQGGANLVHSVDISKRAIEWTDRNVDLAENKEKHTSYAENVFRLFLDQMEDGFFDLIILDPPAFC